jgi:ABC transporter, phosphonate, periplasmic substrate-binding protein
MTLAPVLLSLAISAGPVAFVAVAPGYPGTTLEAQPSMDRFAAALAGQAGWAPGSITAVYVEKDGPGVERLRRPDAALGMVSLPFFLREAAALQLEARLAASQKGTGPLETWALVARKGRVTGPSSLDGWQVASIAGYAPAFVTGTAVATWGRMPATVKVVQTSQVLSALRKAAQGENLAVLLDGAQAAALPTLPFAADLEVVARSEPLPTGIVVTVGKRLPAEAWRSLERALRALPEKPDGAAALEAIRLQGFGPLDGPALAAARKAYAAAAR